MEKEISLMELKEKLKEGYVRAILIIEVLGKPPEHVSQALRTVLDVMKQDKNLTILSRKIYRPKKVKGSKGLFTAFIEVEILAKNFIKLFEVCFDYMPSSIEIIEPVELKFNLAEANEIINDLASRLHKHDGIIKKLSMEKEILQTKLNDLLRGQPIIEAEEVKTELGKKEEENKSEEAENPTTEEKKEENPNTEEKKEENPTTEEAEKKEEKVKEEKEQAEEQNKKLD